LPSSGNVAVTHPLSVLATMTRVCCRYRSRVATLGTRRGDIADNRRLRVRPICGVGRSTGVRPSRLSLAGTGALSDRGCWFTRSSAHRGKRWSLVQVFFPTRSSAHREKSGRTFQVPRLAIGQCGRTATRRKAGKASMPKKGNSNGTGVGVEYSPRRGRLGPKRGGM
jgi:hypothetical protein